MALDPLRVGIDAHAIGQRLTGNEVYVRSLIHEYPALDQSAEFTAYIATPDAEAWLPEGFGRRYISRNPFVRLGADLSMELRKNPTDLLHVQYTAPLFCPVPVVVTVHDVSYLEHPEYFSKFRANQLRLSTRHTLNFAKQVITVSEFSRQRIAKVYGLDPADIVVTPNGPQEQFRPLKRETSMFKVHQALGIDKPYILHVGDLHPRKNQISLIRAFGQLVRNHPALKHHLVLAGKHTWFSPQVLAEIRRSGVEDRIVVTEFVEEDLLPSLYNAADVFVFPSWYEGFGLPAIEAMACGRPVVCSDATALPEVVDGAALLFRPDSVEDQMRAIRDLLLDAELSERMSKKSLQRAKHFNWRDTASKTLDTYYQVAEKKQQLQRERELVTR